MVAVAVVVQSAVAAVPTAVVRWVEQSAVAAVLTAAVPRVDSVL